MLMESKLGFTFGIFKLEELIHKNVEAQEGLRNFTRILNTEYLFYS